MNTTENNKLIAEFMGAIPDTGETEGAFGGIRFPHGYDRTIALLYDTSWDWLMPVVEKIEDIDGGKYDINILKNGTQIFEYSSGGKVIVNNVADISFSNKIEHTYQAVVEFINFYNQQN